MGFYGNITNTSRTTFQFDRIYSSRWTMDQNAGQDGVYAGRYVLVEYDKELSNQNLNYGWYLVTDASGRHLVYSSMDGHKPKGDDNYNNFLNGPTGNPFPVNDLKDSATLKIIEFGPGQHITLKSSTVSYIKCKKDGSYSFVNWSEFISNSGYEGTESSIPDAINNGTVIHAHIANTVARLDNGESAFGSETEYKYAVVQTGAYYSYNTVNELWSVTNGEFTIGQSIIKYPILEQIGDRTSGNYVANFNLDREKYNTSKGYDSTVWQKVYMEGMEKYVQIAELNTVVPTFGVTADAPSLVPLSPHFGTDSTNVYYDLHWQPSWGIRVKAASNTLQIPEVLSNGKLNLSDGISLGSQLLAGYARDNTLDSVLYPSDQRTNWRQVFLDATVGNDGNRQTLYFDGEAERWNTNSNSSVAGAIYFNRAGFNPLKVAYSDDLITPGTDEAPNDRYEAGIKNSGWVNEDSISLSPTGISGHSYNSHNGSADLTVQPDTQELTMMFPSVGDTIAHVWDLVYGGRNTSDTIKLTGLRNMDIEWESGKIRPARRGLRLTGPEGNSYNPKEVETLAGCINTAHDMLGMIISSNTEDELSNASNLDDNRIYYNQDRLSYVRKHKKYTYTPVDESIYVYEEQNSLVLNQKKIDTRMYYKRSGSNFVEATTYDASDTYYLKRYEDIYIKAEGTIVDFPYQDYVYYRDISSSDNERLSDYIKDHMYFANKNYYKITATPVTLNQAYTKDAYWYFDGDNIILDRQDSLSNRGGYYKINTSNTSGLKNLKEIQGYQGVYVPGYYYYKTEDGNFKIDTSEYATQPGVGSDHHYYLLNVMSTQSQSGQIQQYIRSESYDGPKTQEFMLANYEPGRFYTRVGTSSTYNLETGPYDSTKQYYLQIVTYTKVEPEDTITLEIVKEIDKSKLAVYKEATYYTKQYAADGTLIAFRSVGALDFQRDPTMMDKDLYVWGVKSDNSVPPFKTIHEVKNDPNDNTIQQQDAFYQAGMYHFKQNDDYILDTGSILQRDRTYYTIIPTKLNKTLVSYWPNKFYKKVNDEYVLATEYQYPGGDLYTKLDYYVKEDTTGTFTEGALWEMDQNALPAYITLATRSESYETIPLEGYSTGVNTVNGMILQLNKLIEPNDIHTRDTMTVFGVMNELKDLIAKYKINSEINDALSDLVMPNGFRYFQINNATSSATADLTGNTGIISASNTQDIINFAAGNKWIKVVPDVNNKIISIGHTVDNILTSTDSTNLNVDSTATTITNTISIPILGYDLAGHIISKETHTYTLPYGYKFVVIGNASSAVTNLTHAAGTITANNTQAKLNIDSANKWISLAISNGNLQIGHKVADSITTTAITTAVDLSSTASFQIPVITQDEAGHITSNQLKTYNVPINFVNFTVNAASTAVANVEGESTAITLTPTVYNDTISFTPGNKWITLKTGTKEIQFSHFVNTIVTTAKSGTTIDGNTIILQDIDWDEAGHLTKVQNHTYTLPYGFKTLAHANSDAVTGLTYEQDYSANDNKIIAANCADTFKISSSNKWIQVKADPTTKTLTLAHKVNTLTDSSSNVSLSSTTDSTNTTFTVVESITVDEAGHTIAKVSKVYTMPQGFASFGIINSSNNTTELTTNTNSVNALCTADTITVAAGDRWIKLAGDNTNTKISIGHALPDDTYVFDAGQTSTVTLDFGESFKVVHPKADKMGHIGELTEYTITLPSLSFSATNAEANVVTSLTFDDSDNTFYCTKTNLNSIILTGWTYNSEDQSSAAIAASDTLGAALAKLQKKIANEITARENAITTAIEGLDVSNTISNAAGKTLASLSETDGEISYTLQDISITMSQISDLNSLSITMSQVSDLNTLSITTSQISNLSQYTGFDTRYYTKTEIDDVTNGYAKISSLSNYVQTSTLSDYVQTSTLSDYVQTSVLNDYVQTTTLDNYVQTSVLDDYVETSTLSDYVQTSTLSNYVQTSVLNDYVQTSTLSDYVQTSVLNNYVQTSALSDYVQTSTLSGYVQTSTLSDYVQTSTLSGYVQTSALNDYYTANEIDGFSFLTSSDLSGYVQSSTLNDYVQTSTLNDYYTSDDIDEAGFLTSSDLTNYVNTSTTFEYDTTNDVSMTLSQMFAYIKTLEDRIYQLENPTP